VPRPFMRPAADEAAGRAAEVFGDAIADAWLARKW